MRKIRVPKWMIPASIGFILFVGNIASGLLTSTFDESIFKYRPWIIVTIFLSGIVSIIIAILESKQKSKTDRNSDHLYIVDKYNELLNKYLEKIIDYFQYVPLMSVDFRLVNQKFTENANLKLAKVYIPLDTKMRVLDENNPHGAKRYLSAVESIERFNQIVLLGAPGTGKTTFLSYLALSLASHQLNKATNIHFQNKDKMLGLANLLPVYVILREFAAWISDSKTTSRKSKLFSEYILSIASDLGLSEFYEALMGRIQSGNAVLLLDGLDEVGMNDDTLKKLKECIECLKSAYPQTPIVVSCRVLSYQDPTWTLSENWIETELNGLSSEKINSFIDSWYNQLTEVSGIGNRHILSTKLKQAVHDSSIGQLASNPLLLTVMAIVHAHKGELPNARAVLLDDIVDMLLWRWESAKVEGFSESSSQWRQLLAEAVASNIDVKLVFWKLAFNTHERQSYSSTDRYNHSTDISDIELIRAFASLHPAKSYDWAKELIQIINLRAGLILESKPYYYSFPHRSFQEYLAGCHLSNSANFVDLSISLSKQGMYWRDVILLAIGRLTHLNGDIDRPLMLISELLSYKDVNSRDLHFWRKVWLAGECIAEIDATRITRRSIGNDLASKTKDLLLELVSTDQLEPRERSEAGSALSNIGDPRDFSKMVLIPEGNFLMGIANSDVERFTQLLASEFEKDDVDPSLASELVITEAPQHSIILKDYQIGLYPVTNSEYFKFISDTGYKPPSHWRGKQPPARLLNHPVVYVNKEDAEIYCSWLSEKIGNLVRLPSEAEWEKAARGLDARNYPWGDDFDPACCNMKNTGIGGTSPVGIFAGGRSPYGCYDMAGNVWEWTRTKWEEVDSDQPFQYPYNQYDGRESDNICNSTRFVLRGGSFAFNPYSARTTYRDKRVSNDLRHGYIGFRIMTADKEFQNDISAS